MCLHIEKCSCPHRLLPASIVCPLSNRTRSLVRCCRRHRDGLSTHQCSGLYSCPWAVRGDVFRSIAFFLLVSIAFRLNHRKSHRPHEVFLTWCVSVVSSRSRPLVASLSPIDGPDCPLSGWWLRSIQVAAASALPFFWYVQNAHHYKYLWCVLSLSAYGHQLTASSAVRCRWPIPVSGPTDRKCFLRPFQLPLPTAARGWSISYDLWMPGS